MSRILLSLAAEADLLDIFEWGAEQFGEAAAAAYRDALIEALELLRRYPFAGRARPDAADGVRSRPFRSHVILYEVVEEDVLVLGFVHGRSAPASWKARSG